VLITGLPIITLKSLWAVRNINVTNGNAKTMLQDFTKKKRNLLLVQQFGVVFSILLMWLVMPVFAMISNGEDFFKMDHSVGMWIFFAATTIGVIIFARWGYGCYKRITQAAENDLKELDI